MSNPSLKILKINIKWFLVGIILLLLGYIILSVGSTNLPYEKKVFAWHKITLAPIVIVAGYLSIGLSIFKTNQ
jgi:hypothetical protein